MTILALVFVLAAPVLFVYAYLVYPTLLWLAALFVKRDRDVAEGGAHHLDCGQRRARGGDRRYRGRD